MVNDMALREEYHRKYIDYVGIDISQLSYWRKLLFHSKYDKKFLIDQNSAKTFTIELRDIILRHDLRFYVSKVIESPQDFDGLVAFKFEAVEFPGITWYSGNNSDVI